MTTRCIRCGNEIQGTAQFCDDCAAIQAEATSFPQAQQPQQTWGTTPQAPPPVSAPTKCPSCGADLPTDATFCGVCGSQISRSAPTSCSNCGASVAPGTAFCANCGAHVSAMAGDIYAGFWMRFAAWIIDVIILGIVGAVLGLVLGDGPEVSLLSILIGFVYTVGFWVAEGATPGKMALGVRIVSDNGDPISPGQAIGRYFAQILSALILFIGFFMIGWTKKKQGLHDMLAGTVCIKTR